MNNKLLEINKLSITPKKNGSLMLVDNISLTLEHGKTTCIVGESGSGKSLTALSIIKLLSKQLSATGEILFQGDNISHYSEVEKFPMMTLEKNMKLDLKMKM